MPSSKARPPFSTTSGLRHVRTNSIGGQVATLIDSAVETVARLVRAVCSFLAVSAGANDQRGVVACGQNLFDTPPRRRGGGIRHDKTLFRSCRGLAQVVRRRWWRG